MYKRPIRSDELYHFGILGMHWGIRRYQNEDGSLTAAGRRRYVNEMHKDAKEYFKSKLSNEYAKRTTNLSSNLTDSRGDSWNKMRKKGLVGNKDEKEIKTAITDTRKYMTKKYGKDAVNAMKSSGVLFREVSNFDPNKTASGRELTNKILKGNKWWF